MTALAITGDVSIITMRDTGAGQPAWTTMFGWPEAADTHIGFDGSRNWRRDGAAVRLDEAVRRAARPVVLVAEGAACFAAAWWARLTPAHEVARVSGALLFSPLSDDEIEMAARREAYSSPDAPLPFPSLLLDAPARRARLAGLAREWGGELSTRQLPGTGLARTGPWSRAGRLIASVTQRVVIRDLRLARDQRR